jgi:hypothetical protein
MVTRTKTEHSYSPGPSKDFASPNISINLPNLQATKLCICQENLSLLAHPINIKQTPLPLEPLQNPLKYRRIHLTLPSILQHIDGVFEKFRQLN